MIEPQPMEGLAMVTKNANLRPLVLVNSLVVTMNSLIFQSWLIKSLYGATIVKSIITLKTDVGCFMGSHRCHRYPIRTEL